MTSKRKTLSLAHGQNEFDLGGQNQKGKVSDETASDNPRFAGTESEDAKAAADAAAYVGTGQPADASLRSVSAVGAEIKRQAQRLVEWARRAGRLLPDDFFAGLSKLPATSAEHEVFRDHAGNLAVKRTHAGTFGVVPKAHGPGIGATPEFYLRRLALANSVFGMGLRFKGIVLRPSMLIGEGVSPSIVVTQPWADAANPDRPHPSTQQIAAFMEAQGFQRNPNGYFEWNRQADGVRVMDARPANFILTTEGVVPIDLVIDHPAGLYSLAPDDFQLNAPESVAEQKARLAAEKRKAESGKSKSSMLDRAAAPLTATADNTAEMFGGEVRQKEKVKRCQKGVSPGYW